MLISFIKGKKQTNLALCEKLIAPKPNNWFYHATNAIKRQ